MAPGRDTDRLELAWDRPGDKEEALRQNISIVWVRDQAEYQSYCQPRAEHGLRETDQPDEDVQTLFVSDQAWLCSPAGVTL